MWVIKPEKFLNLNFEYHEKFFIELWHSMTHNRSLDTYRVKCMNSRTIIREIAEEIRMGRLNEEEKKALYDEAKEILQEDIIVSKNFPILYAELFKIIDQGNKDRKKISSRNEIYCFVDFFNALEKNYFKLLSEEILLVVQSKDLDKIKLILSSFLSDLHDRGWPFRSLFFSHMHFLKQREYSFVDNLKFLLKRFLMPLSKFDVILKIHGSSKLRSIVKFGEFELDIDPTFNGNTQEEKNLINDYVSNDSPHSGKRNYAVVTYAKTEIEALEGLVAAE